VGSFSELVTHVSFLFFCFEELGSVSFFFVNLFVIFWWFSWFCLHLWYDL